MDRRIERNLGEFFKLLGIQSVLLSEKMQFTCSKLELYLEVRPYWYGTACTERVLMTSAYAPVRVGSEPVLSELLKACYPEKTLGIIQRACFASNKLLLTCATPADSGAELWYELYGIQKRLLRNTIKAMAL